jgi:hypothetical protein
MENFQLFYLKTTPKKTFAVICFFNFILNANANAWAVNANANARILKFVNANANAPLAMNVNAQMCERVQVCLLITETKASDFSWDFWNN